jgi:colanic acid/amylovoran biosynthesis glycosyltransferase
MGVGQSQTRHLTEISELRVAYLTGRAPPAKSTFTYDEIDELGGLALINQAGVVGSASDGWLVPPPLYSPVLWIHVLAAVRRHPHLFFSACWALIWPSLGRPYDAIVAIRSAISACFLSEWVSVDLVHAQFAGPAAATAFVWSQLLKTPYTVRAHAYDVYRPYAWLTVVLNAACRVAVISADGQMTVKSKTGVDASIVRVGIHAREIPHRGERSPGVPLRVLSVGALAEKKGHDLAIQGVRLARDEVGEIALDIFGEGHLFDTLSALIGEDPLTRLKGFTSPEVMRDTYKDYDILIMASRVAANGDRDGIPVVLLEAAAAGVPIISTAVGGIPEFVIPGRTGTLVDPEPGAISIAVRDIARGYAQALTRARAAQALVSTKHDLTRCSRSLADLWHACVHRA